MDPPELKHKINISFALLLSLIITSFVLGGIVTGILGLSDKMDSQIQELKTEIQKLKVEVNGRMDRKAKNHELIHHKINE
jgi:hypothetical protein